MKEILDDGRVKLTPTDWRYSAAIVGIIRALDGLNKSECYEINGDEFIYNPDDIPEDEFIRFLHIFYEDDEFHHLRAKNMLLSSEPEKYVKEINNIFKGGEGSNSICKKLLGHLNFDGTNAKEIISTIDENESELTIKTFEFKSNMYDKYCHTANGKSTLFTDDNDQICRINGYYVDLAQKGKSLGYNFQGGNYEDIREFDYICFGFSKPKRQDVSIFINSNFSVNSLININNRILESNDVNYSLIENLRTSSDFIDNNVEIIIKRTGTEYFETLILNKRAINTFKNIGPYYDFSKFNMEIADGNYVSMQEKIIDAIINNQYIDHLIDMSLKSKLRDKNNNKIFNLIKINQLLYKEDKEMLDKLKPAFAAAKQVNAAMNDNKVRSFKEKLISAITIDDKDTVSKTLLKLSQASGVYFGFANDIFDDYHSNKNVLYTFINTLATKNYEKGEKEDEE